jgi:hypothetical protein
MSSGFPEPDDPGPWSRILTPDPHAACRAEITRLKAEIADQAARIAMLTKEDT